MRSGMAKLCYLSTCRRHGRHHTATQATGAMKVPNTITVFRKSGELR
jgi:hypothetical protein